MQLAREDDLDMIIKFYTHNSSTSGKGADWADMIKRGEVYLYQQEDVLIALGECKTYATQPEVAKVNLVVAKKYRERGLGARLLTFLTQKAIKQGKCPIGSFMHAYCDDELKRLAEKCGYACSEVVEEIGV